MRPSRGDGVKSPTLSLAKTLCSSLIISALISAIAMAFALTSHYKGAAGDLTPIYLAWGLSYGLFALAGIAIAILFLLKISIYPKWNKGASVFGIVYGALVALSGIPLGAFLSKIEFLVSLLIIGICVVGISVLTFRSYREEFRDGKK